MDSTRFDQISKRFADRRMSRRQAVTTATAGLAAATLGSAAAQDASPEASPAAAVSPERSTQTLFLQAFQSGSIAPKADAEDRYVLRLEQGLGQTIFFTDRPERIVGTTPTAQFLGNIGFPAANPPNAALVVEKDDGATEIAVVELFDPTYDQATRTATYEVAVLAEWERELGVGLAETPGDLAAFGPEFGAAHLFIDDCADGTVTCNASSANEPTFTINAGFCYVGGCCQPCSGGEDPHTYWAAQCKIAEPSACHACFGEGQCDDDGINHCTVAGWDSWLIPCAS